MTVENLLAWSAQVALIGGAGMILPLLLRMRGQLRYYQALLALCVALPLVQPWQSEILRVPAPRKSNAPVVTLRQHSAPPPFPVERAVWFTLCAGGALRALWMVAGLVRLRRYRRDAEPLYPLPAAVEAARDRTGADALVCLAREQAGAVTFGLRIPVVLLPPRFLELPGEAQFAVACHELLHVRRRDWFQHMIEEAAAVVFWFHPVMWWIIARIRLAREEAVDAQVLKLTRAREPYVNALISMAGAKPTLDLAPAPLFLRRRHLKERIYSIVQGGSMSKIRLLSSYVSMGAALAGATWMGVVIFPMRGLPQVVTEFSRVPGGAVLSDAPGVTVSAGGEILHRQGIPYPNTAVRAGVGGVVVVDAVLDAHGNVVDARVVSGPDALRRGVLASVLQWHFAPEVGRTGRAQVSVQFAPPPANSVSPGPPPLPPPPPGMQTTTVREIDLSALPQSLQNELRPRVSRFVGRPATGQTVNEFRDAVIEVEPHIGFVFRGDTFALTLSAPPERPAPLPEFPAPADGTQRIRVGGNVQHNKLTEQVRPQYPALARQTRIQGVVRFNTLISPEGDVKQVQLISGHPILVEEAMAAVQKWKYQPTLLNGKPVEVQTQVDVNFTLAQ